MLSEKEIEDLIRNFFDKINFDYNMEIKSIEAFDNYRYQSYIKSNSEYGIIIKDMDNTEYEISITKME